ncbi:MAG: hypothetical protein KIG81_04560 [Thermoguttaceae bacterium]|nr:hypothetical protein [Thermoguttaceae bacterium]
MLAVAIAASAAILALAIGVPIASNISTPRNLRNWYFSKQSVAVWAGAGIALLIVWGIYFAIYLS